MEIDDAEACAACDGKGVAVACGDEDFGEAPVRAE
jgi:hypothetical protein